MSQSGSPLVMVAAGGTGGHLFPAEALGAALVRRGVAIALATDTRAAKYSDAFSSMHVIPSATFRGRDPISIARTVSILGFGLARAYLMLGRQWPDIVVGFGGYPTIPPVMAAALRKIPTLIHEQNAVMGRANRLLAPRVNAIATGFAGVFDGDAKLAAKATQTGNPVRPAVVAVAGTAFQSPQANEPFQLLVFGGSQGARVMADIVPPAIAKLEPHLLMRLNIVQQARDEDAVRVRDAYKQAGVAAEVAPFFGDLPARMAASHLVISRSGASTVAELSAIGRPAILVPLPHALDQDQAANAAVLERAGGAIRLLQDKFTPDRLAASIGAEDNTVIIFSELMDSNSLFLTANADTIYTLAVLDLTKGPLVVEVPPKALGTLNDMWFGWIIDIGNPGPDRGQGGKYLILPPGYDGPLPDSGFHVGRSKTTHVLYAVRAFWRITIQSPPSRSIKNTLKIYPYTPGGYGTSIATALEGKVRLEPNPPIPPTKFVEASGKSFNTIPPNDFSYFEMIDELVQMEPATSSTPNCWANWRPSAS